MSQPTPTRVQCHIETLQRQFAQQPGLPFADLLPETELHDALAATSLTYRER